MITRRKFVQTSLLLSGGLLIRPTSAATSVTSKLTVPSANDWFMPDESEPHARTWMAFGASQAIWGKKLLPEVQRNLALIARTIAQFEPVSMLVRKSDYALARKLVGPSVTLVIAQMDDLWMRDTGSVFVVTDKGGKAAIKFNFNGWGNKQEYGHDTQVASFVAKQAATKMLSTKLILEGGGIKVDGHGTAIITESCILNANRNPGVSKTSCETELKRLLGLEKIIWLPGIKGKDITDGHTDFYARFAKPGVVVAGYDADPTSFDHVVTKKHLKILKAATDASGKRLKVVVIEGPTTIRDTYASDDFAAGYINFYVCNKAVIVPEFGDKKADNTAKVKLQALFPSRKVVQINIDAIAAGGGGIHCTTQQEPKI